MLRTERKLRPTNHENDPIRLERNTYEESICVSE